MGEAGEHGAIKENDGSCVAGKGGLSLFLLIPDYGGVLALVCASYEYIYRKSFCRLSDALD